MKRITGKYALSKDDPHYKKRQSRTISPKDWITKMYIENKQTRYIIWFRCADRVMKITQITNMPGSQNPKKRIFVVAPSNKEYERFYNYYKVARRMRSDGNT